MPPRHLVFALGAVSLLALAGCGSDQPPADGIHAAPEGETAQAFVARVNAGLRESAPEVSAAQWLSSTYINPDSQRLAAKANERALTQLNAWIAQSRRFEGQQMAPSDARAIHLLKLMSAMPAPQDPAKLARLTQLSTELEGMYGAGKACTGDGPTRSCRSLGELEQVLAHSRDYDAQLQAWSGWHDAATPMRARYGQFVDLINEGARDIGFADAGEQWRSGYDMAPGEIAAQTDRLWNQVKPLYQQLHCYARTRLEARYGMRGQVDGGLLPAHLMGNMWQQDWSNLWDLLQPYPEADALDITGALQARNDAQYERTLTDAGLDTTDPFESARDAAYGAQLRALGHAPDANERERLSRSAYDAAIARLGDLRRDADLAGAKDMARRAQDFYTSLGMPPLPESYWTRAQFIKPRDREVVCHASAWDMDMAGDVRTKMCIRPDEDSFTTLYHELGHLYYDLAYHQQPPVFQAGANDGFHEAIGDTIVLAMTPRYLASIGLVREATQDEPALVNAQMRMALSKVAFLPFGLMIDRWRWGVFDGSIKPDHYNRAWWQLKAQYQGVAPATPRGEEYFDAGAKYHVPANTPYTRYFMAAILQFQFYKALCDAAGHTGPLNQCSFYGNKVAGQKFWAMLSQGASQPWPQTLKALTGSETMDAGPMLEYFQPLQAWLNQQNEGRSCGWQVPAATAADTAG
ncbi:M2 family metallopeptidase [Pseudoxanthomonas winnipegensis]|uniref:M2 family metallopeptidase n=1 Tax=Pseudoxanthomonas winnipegensis TaxID=2480810 RepID=UPI00102DA9C6|nr:M2 family metallopeptidase [Pseudoxanthomonas winnipegensis]RZZ86374.1 peptidase M2 family protein [Pseudoxanthomonas winnipegensis]TAA41391.1 peptidase M2 family protein [Pseudoxanthomonas winnipegensis]TBV77307.1 peptidase M2 family protein [Pseudoxanthomonas winnipegensis]